MIFSYILAIFLVSGRHLLQGVADTSHVLKVDKKTKLTAIKNVILLVKHKATVLFRRIRFLP